jgi:CRP/FNR family cyclic AMP-dependent transcriptional regulator
VEPDAADVLARTDVFRDCAPELLAWLASRSERHAYHRHDVIVRQGEPGDFFYVIVSGSVKLLLTSSEGEVVVLTTLGPTDTFGELALLDGGPRSATAEALTDCDLLGVARPALLELLAEQPGLADALLRSLGSSLRRLTGQMADAVFLDLPGRVAKLLLALAGMRPPAESPAVIELQLTQSELASMVGGTRQSVNRILSGFESRGLVEMQGRTIVIKRPDLLSRRAEA